MTEVIRINEVKNDGRTIHLYFNGLVGLYAAYGISAFLLNKISTASASYSKEMQLPVVVLNSAHYEEVKKQLELVKDVQNYRCLRVNEPYDEAAYAEWAAALREKTAENS